jgi:hypothetical protein
MKSLFGGLRKALRGAVSVQTNIRREVQPQRTARASVSVAAADSPLKTGPLDPDGVLLLGSQVSTFIGIY